MFKLEIWHLVIALVALIGPALLYAGITIGRINEKTQNTKDWLKAVDAEAKSRDRDLERRLTNEFKTLGDRLEEAVKNGWMHCPLAQKEHDKGGHGS